MLLRLPSTSAGRMLGDYISTSFVGHTPIPVFSLARARQSDGRFDQAIYAVTGGLSEPEETGGGCTFLPLFQGG